MLPVNVSKLAMPLNFERWHWSKHFVQDGAKTDSLFWAINAQFAPILEIACQPPVIKLWLIEYN